MRIQAINLLSNFNTLRQNKSVLPQVNLQKNNDSVRLSESGLQKSQGTNKAENIVKYDPATKKMDEALKKAQNILEKMHDLATLAQDKSLDDLDRVEIQIELADLNDNLFMIPGNLRMSQNLSREQTENWQDSQMSSILERMRTRISSGEKWNVREVWQPNMEVRVKHDENGAEFYEISSPGWYTVSDDVKIKSQSTLTSEIVQTDKSVPTVRERLENLTQYLVMDSESAEKSSQLIQQQINKIQEWRDELPQKISEAAGDTDKIDSILMEAFNFLDELARPANIIVPSLNAPNEPSYFLHGGEVYDRIQNQGVIALNEDGERIPIPNYEISQSEETQPELFAKVESLSGRTLKNINTGSNIIYVNGLK